jgi:hypothetical protein
MCSIRPGPARSLPTVVVWKDPGCGCCEAWVTHLRYAGFTVIARDTSAMTGIKQARGVPEALWSCHTAVIDGYVIEGHVPAADISRLLTERPQARGLAVPGMPQSAPGMDIAGQPYTVLLFGIATGDAVFARH